MRVNYNNVVDFWPKFWNCVCIDKYFLMDGMNDLFTVEVKYFVFLEFYGKLSELQYYRLTRFVIKFDGFIHPRKYSMLRRSNETADPPCISFFLVFLLRLLIRNQICSKSTLCSIVMSKTKEQIVENRLFRSGPESALQDQIEMCTFDGAGSGTNSDVLVSFLLDVGTFVKRLLLYCFDITTIQVKNWTLSWLLCMSLLQTGGRKNLLFSSIHSGME